MATYSKSLEVYTAKLFKDGISQNPGFSNVYLTFGRAQPWSSEVSPPASNTSGKITYDIWKNMIGGKRVTGNDVKHAIRRHDWTSGETYFAYDDTTDSKTLLDQNTKMVVLNSSNHVYKCLGNNYGAQSTSEPTSTSTTGDFQTADGYIWKYLYTLTAEELLRFTTSSYIPVKTLTVDDSSLQWDVQDNAVDGAIHNILVESNGSGYTSNTVYVVIEGDGQDANAFAVINTTSNVVSSIVVDNKGSGYTYANVTLLSTVGSGANARAIISPPGGHGSDPVFECGGSFLIFNIQLEDTESGILTVANDFRQLSLIENPYAYDTTNTISNTVVSQVTSITLSGSSADYIEDEWVYQGPNLDNSTFRGLVVEWDSGNNTVHLSNVEGSPLSELLIGESSGAGRYISSVTDPDLEPYTGHILYTDNIVAISRAPDQTEDFKLIFKY